MNTVPRIFNRKPGGITAVQLSDRKVPWFEITAPSSNTGNVAVRFPNEHGDMVDYKTLAPGDEPLKFPTVHPPYDLARIQIQTTNETDSVNVTYATIE